MTNTLAVILRGNEKAKTLRELVPVVLAAVAAYHRGDIELPSADLKKNTARTMWSPSILVRPRPRLKDEPHARLFLEVQIAKLLNRLQDDGHGRQKSDRSIVSAFRFLRKFESGQISDAGKFCDLAKNLSGRDVLTLARI